jgi:chromosome partitioning protein
MGNIIGIVNQKGGVAKTTSAVNLAYYFAEQGERVLLVDMDVQGHDSLSLNIEDNKGLYRLLIGLEPIEKIAIPARSVAKMILDVVTSSKDSEDIPNLIMQKRARELYIARILENARVRYDKVFLDLAPGSDIMHVGSLVACDYYLIPAKMDFLALDGVTEVIKTVDSLREIPTVEPPALIGVVPTMYDRTTNETTENIKRLGAVIGAKRILPPILNDTRVREASARGLTIKEYAPETPAWIGYKNGAPSPVNSKGMTGGYLHLAEIIKAVVR